MCRGQQPVPVVVPSAAYEMMVDMDVQGLGQALGPRLEEAGKRHPIALIEINAQHEVGNQKEMITARMGYTFITVGTSTSTWARSGSV